MILIISSLPYNFYIPTYCADCIVPPLEHCVKDNGMTEIDGSEWLETPCKKCRCVNSVITCWAVTPVCPPLPEPHCIELPGECCPTYDCTKPQYVYISLFSRSSQGFDVCKLRLPSDVYQLGPAQSRTRGRSSLPDYLFELD